jgi:ABC-type transporter Mla MlaB component
MIRVTKTDEGERTRITIDGQLSRDYIQAVEICCNQAISQGKPVDIFLRRVPTIDETGLALLSRLAANGIRLLAMSVGDLRPVSPTAPARGNHR